LAAGTNVFADVIKSPAVWTGKDGIKSASDLLNNVPKQSQIQQDLMAKGVAGLAAVGVPVKNLSSQGLAGMALNAAKDLPSAEAFAKGLPIPGDATGAVQAEFKSAVRDGAFAVNLVQTKIPTVFKQEDIPVPAENTVNRATLDAASTRVIGNDKIPTPNYGPTEAKIENQADVEDYADKALTYINQYLNPAGRGVFEIESKLSALENQQTISQAAFSAIDGEYQQVRDTFNSNARVQASVQYLEAFNKLTQIQRGNVNQLPTGPKNVQAKQALILDKAGDIRQRINKLKLKIEGISEGE